MSCTHEHTIWDDKGRRCHDCGAPMPSPGKEGNEMVERVARAIVREKAVDGIGPWERVGFSDRAHYFALARAAIKAMRQPTKEMIEAGWSTAAFYSEDVEPIAPVEIPPQMAWVRMIDEALK